jgi:integrase/recombinase XerD
VHHLRVLGKGSKIRYVPLHPAAAGAIVAYREAAGHGDDKGRRCSTLLPGTHASPGGPITPDGVYRVLARYAGIVGIDVDGFGPHALRATAITNALEHDADLEKVQDWVGHPNISTTRMYDRRKHR